MTEPLAVGTGLGREFPYTERDFERVRRLIFALAGIALSANKRELVYNRLARCLRALGCASFAEYLDRIERGADPAERQAFVNALTTNLTGFFRESHHFSALAEHLRRPGASQPQVVWSCACSSGEEPWSIAITAAETFATLSPPVRILASDVDTQVLERARTGIYPLDRVSRLEPGRLRRFFLRGSGANRGCVRVRPELRECVVFRRINLLDREWPLRGPFDAIFCRNVMIYFDRPTQLAILERFAPLLRPDGLLFVGHSEALWHAAHLFRPCGRTVYAPARRSEGA
jgi:chemotaxis protein methyltransferase CheR